MRLVQNFFAQFNLLTFFLISFLFIASILFIFYAVMGVYLVNFKSSPPSILTISFLIKSSCYQSILFSLIFTLLELKRRVDQD